MGDNGRVDEHPGVVWYAAYLARHRPESV